MKKVVLIIEDEDYQLEMLEQLVLAVSEDVEIYTADNVALAYQILMEKTIDVFVVDIIMDTEKPGDTSGIRLVEKVRGIPKYMFTPVIFVTSLEDPDMYAYKDLNCIDYIEKPYEPEQIIPTLKRALNYTTNREEQARINFRKDGILYPINIKDIVYMEILKRMMHIYLSSGDTLEIPYRTCKQVLDEADSPCLLQCSRSTVVNKDYILSIDVQNQYIVFKKNFGRVDIGITYKRKILAEFANDC